MLSSGMAILKVAEPSYSLADVRLTAMQSGLSEIYFNAQSRVISFSPNRSGELVEYPRINVYYSTRTVGTCIDHPAFPSKRGPRAFAAFDESPVPL